MKSNSKTQSFSYTHYLFSVRRYVCQELSFLEPLGIRKLCECLCKLNVCVIACEWLPEFIAVNSAYLKREGFHRVPSAGFLCNFG